MPRAAGEGVGDMRQSQPPLEAAARGLLPRRSPRGHPVVCF